MVSLSRFEVISRSYHPTSVVSLRQARQSNSQTIERTRDLQQQDMRVTMLMHDQQPLDCPPLSKLLVILLPTSFPRIS